MKEHAPQRGHEVVPRRRPIHSLVALVAMSSAGIGCIAAQGEGEQGEDVGAAALAQIPPIKLSAMKLLFSVSGAPWMKVAATGEDPYVGTDYQEDTEYWHADPTPLTTMTSIEMDVTSGEFTEAELDDFLDGTPPAFAAEQTVDQSSWTQGEYDLPSGTTARLFRAVDPDNPTTYIGLLLVQDKDHHLQASVWYKSVQPTNGWIWKPEDVPPDGLTWTLVTGDNNVPTLNPAYIQSGKSWYHITQS
jgi:hypothetical protein